MFAFYDDILTRIPEPPSWWDENRVPRFCAFHPSKLANIYADEAALLLVSCQLGPVHHFQVAMSAGSAHRDVLARRIRDGEMLYGDPPSVAYCNAADANAVEIEVLQYWRRVGPAGLTWERDPALEVDVLTGGREHHRHPAKPRRR